MPKRKHSKKKRVAVALDSDGESESDPEEEEEGTQDFGDDESIDDDEAFNSEDERKYGAFFSGGNDEGSSDESDSDEGDNDDEGDDDDEEEEEGEESEDEEEGDGGQYMLDLLNNLDSPKDDSGKRAKSDAKAKAAAATNVSESQFASSVVKKGNLTLDSLMEGLQDTKGFGVMQKSLKKIALGETTQAPVAKVVSKRAERKVHYESQSKEVSLWLEAVQQNRKAETLDFRNKERLNVTRDNLIEKFEPVTNFEKAIHAALQEAGQEDEEAILKAEEAAFLAQQDDLGGNEQTLEEYKKRRSQLAKMRALMFYHEQKRHRINKIKSKKYRRIRKKQRERAKESEIEAEAIDNPDILKELEEKEEFERMKERMTFSHKNTSKWAKRILKRGKNVDADTRKALSAQLKRGDDLLKKMTHASNGGDSDESESEDLVESARKVLQDTNDNDEEDERQGLFKLKFMQKGIEKQRAKAKEEARQLLCELEANEKLDDYDEAVMYDEDPHESKHKKRKVASKADMKDIITDGDLVASSLKFGKSNAVSVSGRIDIDLGLGATADSAGNETKTVSEHTATMTDTKDVVEENAANSDKRGKKKSKKAKAKGHEAVDVGQSAESEEANPWMSSSQGGVESKGSKKKTGGSALKTGVVDVERVLDVLDGSSHPSKGKVGSKGQSGGPSTTDPQSITLLSQEELVRRAFATSDEQEVEEEFAREKADVEDEENDVKTSAQKKKEKDMAVVSGWGSWAGEGAPPPKPPKKLPKHLQPPKKKETKRKRQDARRPNIIIREKRVKKTADKFMLSSLPYPYKSREEYERAMTGAVGKEWNVTQSVKDMTRPEIQTRAGKVIQPLSVKVKKQHRGPAKF